MSEPGTYRAHRIDVVLAVVAIANALGWGAVATEITDEAVVVRIVPRDRR